MAEILTDMYMLSNGKAPDFTAPKVAEEIKNFNFHKSIDRPVVLVFFPGAFTPPCKEELTSIRDRIDEFGNAEVYGISVDTPFSLQEFRDQNNLNFSLISDTNKEIIADYDVSMNMEDIGYHRLARRAIFVINEYGEITYSSATNDPREQPDLDRVIREVNKL